jgi:N-acetylneuraminic acid mutarotase
MPRFKTFAAAVLAAGTLLIVAAFAQGTGRWTAGTPMPSARTEVAVAELGGKIYVVGGFRGERELEIYNPSADRWSRGASIPRAVHHAAAVGLNNKLYVIGGFVEGWTPADEVHEYDPASDHWQRLAALPTTRGALAAAVLDGKIHAVGGIGWRGRNTPAHEVS